jgi:triacylglycerol lipase
MDMSTSETATCAGAGLPDPRLPVPGMLRRLPAALPSAIRSLGTDLGRLVTPRGLRGVAVEAAWVAAHLTMYPWGVLRDRQEPPERYDLADLAPHQRGLVLGDVEAAGTPILLVHGMLDNRAIFTVLRRGLRRRGFERVFTINYSPLTNDIRAAARDLSGAIEELVARTGYERIHLVGHSLGGLIARYYVQRLDGSQRVHTLVTLGTPHAGTWPAYGLPLQLCRQLRPGSELYTELALPTPGCRTRFVAYWSDLDQIVIPHANGRLEHPDLTVRNVHVRGVGHMSLPIQGEVVRDIAQLLGQLDPDGTTVRAGVTPLPAQEVAG